MSRFALTRAFAASAGLPIMQYVRGRRLTEAARRLSGGASDILTVAFEAAYGSHEAFTRAFVEQFGTTPEAVRERGSMDGLAIVDAVRAHTFPTVPLEPPRIERAPRILLAGLTERNFERIPFLWQQFGPYMGVVPGQIGSYASFGVCSDGDDDGNCTYLAAVEVASFGAVPAELVTMRLAAAHYAVFVHRDHISTIRSTFDAIWREWQPYNVALDAPLFERYGEDFNPNAGTGPVEIWIPIPEPNSAGLRV